jgi:hypothetical protein
MKMNDLKCVYPLTAVDALEILKGDGIIVGKVIMNSYKFYRRCSLLGVNPDKVLRKLWDF